MKHFFDAVADNGVLQGEFDNTLPRTRDQVKEQLIRGYLVLASLHFRPDVTKLLYWAAVPEPAVPGGDFPQPVR